MDQKKVSYNVAILYSINITISITFKKIKSKINITLYSINQSSNIKYEKYEKLGYK